MKDMPQQNPTWGDIMWRHIKNGVPREEAVFRADMAMERRERERMSETRLNLTLASDRQAALHVTGPARSKRKRV